MSSSNSSSLSPSETISTFGSPPITIVLAALLLVFFVIGFFSIYFCRCFMEGMMQTWNIGRNPSDNLVNPAATPANLGLDPSLIQLFPTFTFSSVKDFRREKCGVECAICLGDFDDDDMLRLLTVCYHVFHQECIDLWFESHKTCPVCRQDLDLPRETLEKNQELDQQNNNNVIQDVDSHGSNNNNNNNNNGLEHAISIDVRAEGGRPRCECGGGGNAEGLTMDGDHDHCHHGNEGKEIRCGKMQEGYARSHSTGHSIVATRGEDEDKYTLRLMDHVKMKISKGGHHSSACSCITFGEFSSPGSSSNNNVDGDSGEVAAARHVPAGGDTNKV